MQGGEGGFFAGQQDVGEFEGDRFAAAGDDVVAAVARAVRAAGEFVVGSGENVVVGGVAFEVCFDDVLVARVAFVVAVFIDAFFQFAQGGGLGEGFETVGGGHRAQQFVNKGVLRGIGEDGAGDDEFAAPGVGRGFGAVFCGERLDFDLRRRGKGG